MTQQPSGPADPRPDVHGQASEAQDPSEYDPNGQGMNTIGYISK